MQEARRLMTSELSREDDAAWGGAGSPTPTTDTGASNSTEHVDTDGEYTVLTASSTSAGPMSVPVHLLSHSGDATPHDMVADSGSGHSFVTQAVVDSLGLQTHPLLKRVTWAGFVGGAVHYSNQGVTITVRYSPDITIQHTFIVAPTAPVPIILGRDEMSRGSECHMLIDPDATTPRLFLSKFNRWIDGTPTPSNHLFHNHTFITLDAPVMAPPGVHLLLVEASTHLNGSFTIDRCEPHAGIVLEAQVTKHRDDGQVAVVVTNNTHTPIPLPATPCLARVFHTVWVDTTADTHTPATTVTATVTTDSSTTTAGGSKPTKPRTVEELLKDKYQTADEDGTDPFSDATVPEAQLDTEFAKLLQRTTTDHTLSATHRRLTLRLLRTHRAAFSTSEQKVGKMSGPGVSFTMRNQRPIFIAPYPTSPLKSREILRQVEQLARDDVIGPTRSPYNFPLVLVDKGGGKAPRLAIDLRAFNQHLVPEYYPPPIVRDLLAALSTKKVFTVLDCSSAFQLVPLATDDDVIPSSERLCFTDPSGRRWAYKRLTFGVADATCTFSRLLGEILRGEANVDSYVDDILGGYETVDDAIASLGRILALCVKHGLKLSVTKCVLFGKSVDVLGHTVSHGTIAMAHSKVAAVTNLRPPQSKAEVQVALGILAFSRRFCEGFSDLAAPISDLLRKAAGPWTTNSWSPECQTAFDQIKRRLTAAPTLQGPRFDRGFVIWADASARAAGASLMQLGDDGKHHAIEYYSKLFSPSELKYSVAEREALAIVLAAKRFRYYLLFGPRFRLAIRSDHQGLQFLYKHADERSRLFRWAQLLAEHRFDISYVPGTSEDHAVPDALSRLVEEAVADVALWIHLTPASAQRPLIHRTRCAGLSPPAYDAAWAGADVFIEDVPGIANLSPFDVTSHTDATPVLTTSSPPPRRCGARARRPPDTFNTTPTQPTKRAPRALKPPTPIISPLPPTTFRITHLIARMQDDRGRRGWRVRWAGYEATDDTIEPDRRVKSDMTTVSYDELVLALEGSPIPRSLPDISTTFPRWVAANTTTPTAEPLTPTPTPSALTPPNPDTLPPPPPFPTLPPTPHSLFPGLTVAQILRAQRADPFTRAAINRHTKKKFVVPTQRRAWTALFASDVLLDTNTQLLMRLYTPKKGPRVGDTVAAVIIPAPLIARVLAAGHEACGHHGQSAVHWLLQTRVWFPAMKQRVVDHVASCSLCTRAARDKRQWAFGGIPVYDFCDAWGIDFAGPFKICTTSDEYLCVIIDHSTKWAWAIPTRTTSSADAGDALVHAVLSAGTIPGRLFSDRGAFTQGALYLKLLHRFGIDKARACSYSPTGDSHAESWVKNVKRLLRKACQDHPGSWNIAAPWAAFSYNQSYNSTIGTTPYFARHAREPRTPRDALLAGPQPDTPSTLSELVDMVERVNTSIKAGVAALHASYATRNAELRGARSFTAGDQVYLHRVYPDSTAKAGIDTSFFLPFHPELYTVLTKHSEQHYSIRRSHDAHGATQVVHVHRLKPHQPRQDAIEYSDLSGGS